MSDSKTISRLLFKYMQDTLTPAEEEKLDHWKQLSPGNLKFLEELAREKISRSPIQKGHPAEKQQLEERIFKKIATQVPDLQGRVIPMKRTWWRYGAAAAVVLLLANIAW